MTEVEFLNEVGAKLCNIEPNIINEFDQVKLQNLYLYSVVCMNGLMSLHDNDIVESKEGNLKQGNGEVSVQHLKIRIADIISRLESASKNEVNLDFFEGTNSNNEDYVVDSEVSSKVLVESIYNLYDKAGFFYHKPNKVKPSITKKATVGNVCFVRSSIYNPCYKMSGAGIYTKTEVLDNNMFEIDIVQDLFGLQKVSCIELYETVLKESSFKDFTFSGKSYLSYLSLKTKSKYWSNQDEFSSDDVKLVREEINGFHKYFLAKKLGNNVKYYPLGDHFKKGLEYIPLARAILEQKGILQPISYEIKQKFAFIHLGYLLPPSEQTFFELYSWPINSSAFNRIMHIDVFYAFKNVLERTGYIFTKV